MQEKAAFLVLRSVACVGLSGKELALFIAWFSDEPNHPSDQRTLADRIDSNQRDVSKYFKTLTEKEVLIKTGQKNSHGIDMYKVHPRLLKGKAGIASPAITSPGVSRRPGIIGINKASRVGNSGWARFGTEWGSEVAELAPGGPAELAGIKVRDAIITINGKGVSQRGCLSDLQGKVFAGDKFIFRLMGPNAASYREVSVVAVERIGEASRPKPTKEPAYRACRYCHELDCNHLNEGTALDEEIDDE